AVGVYEITRAQYAAFVRATGTDGAPTVPEEEEQLPAVHVDFADAQAYVEWLSHMTGERYRLLSEAEWEYVARAQTQGAYFFGDESTEICRYANIADERTKVRFNTWYAAACDDGHSKLAPVGRFEPNPFGVYDIYGNAAEWVEDCWHLGYVDAPTDGSPWTAGPCETRVVRGGGWDARADDVRSAARYSAAYASDDRGIRVAREL
ncbi:MAG: SUMF1/EgtB/PvdO family nonheme iron enzyme, partial [Gammaproteobacteria bacterium]